MLVSHMQTHRGLRTHRSFIDQLPTWRQKCICLQKGPEGLAGMMAEPAIPAATFGEVGGGMAGWRGGGALPGPAGGGPGGGLGPKGIPGMGIPGAPGGMGGPPGIPIPGP